MKKLSLPLAVGIVLSSVQLSAQTVEQLHNEIQQLKQEYEQRLAQLEQKLSYVRTKNDTAFNPAISLILDGQFSEYKNDAGQYQLSGFPLAGEAGLAEQGFSVGHTELAISANIDEKFYGKFTAAVAQHDGETELEVEEAFVQTMALGYGLTARFGRFFSAVGYLNEQHKHAQDFSDVPLVYRGLLGNQLIDDGISLRMVAPTELFIEIGAEAFSGKRYPGAGEHSGVGAWSVFTHIGGDIGMSHSWQLGLSHWSADVKERSHSAHSHGHAGEHEDEHDTHPVAHAPVFNGDSHFNAIDFVYKWAPAGNARVQHFTLQFEYFNREEDGSLILEDDESTLFSDYDGQTRGWYAQMVYQFMPQWSSGLRFDSLHSDHHGLNHELLEQVGFDNEGHHPQRWSVMTQWMPSEFSRIRLQYNHDKSYPVTDKQWLLQYTFSLGAHGAHQF